MQLDLFLDNRRSILLNDAGRHLRKLQLPEALALYRQLLEDESDDPELLDLERQVIFWAERLRAFHAANPGPDRIHELWTALTASVPTSLSTGLLNLMISELMALPEAERIYRPPRFHIGYLLLSLQRDAEAVHWFDRALAAGIEVPARILGWCGEALTRLGDGDQALVRYRDAFLEDPTEIDLKSLKNEQILDLLAALENEDLFPNKAEALTWLPVWGRLQGVFSLSLNLWVSDPVSALEALESAHAKQSLAPARLWYEDLRYAEYLRTRHRNDSELIRIRRRMRSLNSFMFQSYLNILSGNRDGLPW